MRVVTVGNASGASHQERRQLRCAAYNIAHGRGGELGADNWTERSRAEVLGHLSAIADQIARARVDIVVLNEVDFDCTWSWRIDQAAEIAKEAGFAYVVEQRNLDVTLPFRTYRFGNAVLSRFPVSDARFVEFPALSRRERLTAGNHDGLLVTVETPFGPLDVFAAHLEYRSEDRRADCADIILQIVEARSHALVVLGDFNSTPQGLPAHQTGASGRNAMDALLASGELRRAQCREDWASYLTFPSEDPNRAIDWILATPELVQVKVETVESDLSDHLMVYADIAATLRQKTDGGP